MGDGSIDVSTGERVPAWSPWNPERVRWTANRYGAMNRRFPNPGFVSLGVYGEYGDASMFTGLAKLSETYAVRWKEQLKVEPPASGYWCGDDFAKASWQKNLVAEYGSVESAYKNWGVEPADPKQAPIPLGPSYPYPARLEFMDWYRAAIPALVRSLGDIGRNIFKESLIVVPIGPPDDHPGLGLDIYRVAEAVKVNADALMVSNVGYFDFANNWAMSLGRIRGAARALTLPIWTQASTLKTGDFGQQFFEALALGSRGYVGWPSLYRANASELDALAANLLVGSPAVDVAVLHPTSSHLLAPPQPAPPLTYRAMVELRDYADFDVLEESAVIAGALKPYRVAIVFEGTVWKAETLQELSEWVEAGGVVVAYDFGKMADPQGNTAVYQRLFGFASGLPAAADTSRWVGELPASYTIDLGTKWDTEYLLGGWGPAAEGVRLAKNGAVLRVPVSREKNSILTISFRNFRSEGQTLEIRSQGKVLAGVSPEGGLQQFRFSADKDLAPNGVLALEMTGLSADTHVPIDRITVSESDTQAEPVPLKGRFEAPV
ncbi:MAG: hypothetical protein H0W86_08610, partial [Armatimonadetes bacterium]|nr:hypothetical protein [Armatimonadota bacterium]